MSHELLLLLAGVVAFVSVVIITAAFINVAKFLFAPASKAKTTVNSGDDKCPLVCGCETCGQCRKLTTLV